MRAQAERDARRLRIRARRDVSTALTGAYRSAYRGHGLTFEELRDYQPGEDASSIEWNATARLGYPVAVQMREERDLLLALLIDVSVSLDFGFGERTKLDAIRRAAAALAVAGVRASDRVALTTFARDRVQTLRPAAGPQQLERIFRALEEPASEGPTDAAPALSWASDTLPRHSVVILISDLLFPDPGAALAACARKHDLSILRISDAADELPARIAPIRVSPAEEGRAALWRRTPRVSGRGANEPLAEDTLRTRGADCGVLQSGEKLIPSLSRFLGRRIGAARALTRIALLLVLFAGCAPETNPVRGLEIRMHIDRPQARVGDALGVTIEIDTPPGFSVGRPDPPTAAGAFVTEAIETVESLDLEGGLRHRVLWTLRAKWVGEQVLPSLQIPLIHPEGRIEPLPVGGVPFAVVSVRAELPEREVYFDLRDPEPARGSRAPWVAGGLIAAILSAVLAAAWWRRRHGVLGAIPDPRVLAASALAALEAGDEIAELRPRADHFSDTMRHYVAQRWSLHGQALTPSELGEPVAVGLVELLQRLDAERFATAPEVREIERSGAEARAWFRDAVGS